MLTGTNILHTHNQLCYEGCLQFDIKKNAPSLLLLAIKSTDFAS